MNGILANGSSAERSYSRGESLSNIVYLAISSIVASPESAHQSVRENARVVWQVVGGAEWSTWVYIEDNDYGIEPVPNAFCARVAGFLLDQSLTPVGSFFCWNIGTTNVVMLVLLLFAVARKEGCRITLIVPPLAYNLFTMLLLCGPSHRYFYCSSVLVILLSEAIRERLSCPQIKKRRGR